MDIVRTLHLEAEAARSLLRSLHTVLDGDDQAQADAVEGETNLHEAVDAALSRLAEIDAYIASLISRIEDMRARKDRFAAQADAIRAALVAAMEAAGLKRLERDVATVSLRPSPPRVVITSEADVPSAFWTEPRPVLDRKAIADALKAGQSVPGAELSNQVTTCQIRWK
jgi:hypothetical protein